MSGNLHTKPANIDSLLNSSIIIVGGHFGSGKTNVAIGLASVLNKLGKSVALVDLDIVNPYFRAADSTELLEAEGIRCINPQFANTNVDVPSLKADIYSIFVSASKEKNFTAVIDVGGDNGAVALGRFAAHIKECGYTMLYVANKYRPLVASPKDALKDLREIEQYASGLKFSHIVNNSNLGCETDEGTIKDSISYTNELSALSQIPVVFTSVFRDRITESLKNNVDNIFPIPDSTKKYF